MWRTSTSQLRGALLLDAPCPRVVCVQDGHRWTALFYAVRGGHLKCVALLLERDAEINHPDNVSDVGQVLCTSHATCGWIL